MRNKIYLDYYIHDKCLNKRYEDAIYVVRRRDPQVKLTINDMNYFLATENMRANKNHENHALYAD